MSGFETAGLILATLPIIQSTAMILKGRQDVPIAITEMNNLLVRFGTTLKALQDYSLGTFGDRSIGEQLERAAETIKKIKKLLQVHADNSGTKRSRAISMVKWAAKDRAKAERLLQELSAHNSALEVLLNAERMQKPRLGIWGQTSETIIAVMGATGSGKSHLIHQITQSDEVKIGHGLLSETQDVHAYSITVDNRVITLVDTPGFDDTFMTDALVLEKLATWMSTTYRSKQLLSGVIYLHDIQKSRMRGSDVKSLEVFDKLVGPESFKNILLVTTKWDLLPNISIGESREDILRDKFWRNLITRGCTTARSFGDRSSALKIMETVAFDLNMATTSGAPLTIQKEIVDQEMPLEITSAGEALARRLDAMEENHRKQINSIENQHKLERDRMQERIDKLQQEQAKLKAGQLTANQPEKRSVVTDIYMRFTAEDLLTLSPPPPYTPREPSRAWQLVLSIRDLAVFSFEPISEIYKSTSLAIQRLLRPKIQPGYTRIEWICTCGDVLYGDYKQRSPASLQKLAIELNGRLISKPTTQPDQRYDNDSNSSSLESPDAQSNVQSQGQRAGSASNLHTSPAGQSTTNPFITGNAMIQSESTSPKWLELCIRSGPDTYLHEEIDARGEPSDQMVFHLIREKYRSCRTAVRPFHIFGYKVPTGGVFVQPSNLIKLYSK